MSDFPSESTLHDTHILFLGFGTYDVFKLIRLTSHIVPAEKKVSDLDKLVPSEHWWIDDDDEIMSPKMFLDEFRRLGSWEALAEAHPPWSAHIAKTRSVDCRHPVLIYQGEVIDGMHRVIRAVIEGMEALPARVLHELPNDARYHKPA